MDKLAQGNDMQELMSRHQDAQARSATLENQMQEVSSRHQEAEARTLSLEQELSTMRMIQDSSTKDDARMRVLEKELADMAADYQHLTREAVEVEKEREKVEALVDTLRESIEGLETQLSDEKVRWLGVQRSGTPEPGAREMTSTMVMRTEFKKMMRETRAEAVRMLRVSHHPSHQQKQISRTHILTRLPGRTRRTKKTRISDPKYAERKRSKSESQPVVATVVSMSVV